MASRTLEVIIAGDASGAKRAFNQVDKQATDTDNTIRSKMSASSAAIGAAAVAGVAAIGFALKGAWDAAEESAKIGRETARVIESTGAAAWTTADAVGEFADKLSMATGVDDELIQSSENLLLTFTNVRNAFGEGNQVFDDGARLALDMSTVLGTDLNAATLQVGKALQDPIRGITALRRAGVSFTKQQEEQIKTMVESGDTLGAQKLIIAELSKEFGGAAAAAATPLDKLKVTVGNLQEKIGTALIPVVEKAANVFTSWIGWLEEHEDFAKVLAIAIGVVLVGAIVAYTASMASAAVATIAATWPILLIIAAIALLVAGVIYAYNNFEWFKTAVDETWDAIQQIISFAWNEVIKPVWDAIVWYIQNVTIPAFKALWPYVQQAWEYITTAVSWAWNNVIQPIWDKIYAYVQDILIPAMQTLWQYAQQAWQYISAGVSAAWTVIKPIWDLIWRYTETILVPGMQRLWQVVQVVWSSISASVSAAGNTLGTVFGWIGGGIENLENGFRGLASVVSSVFNGLASAARAAFQGIRDAWNSTVGGKGISIPGFLGFGGVDMTIPRLHSGGIVPGAPGSDVLTVLQAGEQVLSVRDVQNGGAGMTINVIMPPGSDGEDVVDAIRRYERRNGTGWRN